MKKSTTTNTFKGLVMDLNPIITPNNILTDALNATLLTNNGNENVLLNDIGNGRVHTAFLPEGYIPVGSCEFGDIIYIASYNPFLDKCQLGCFPSPQRIISNTNKELLKQSIELTDFQELDKNDEPTGKLKLFSVKKIVYENNLTSGDKYIISANNISEEEYLTDVGNTDHIIGNFPKLYKIKVVSIQDDGKIVELSSGIKWYNKNQKDYFLLNANIGLDEETGIDLDEWQTATSSAYSIFSSKVSGKLALLLELESITGFSLTWEVRDILTYITNNSNVLALSISLEERLYDVQIIFESKDITDIYYKIDNNDPTKLEFDTTLKDISTNIILYHDLDEQRIEILLINNIDKNYIILIKNDYTTVELPNDNYTVNNEEWEKNTNEEAILYQKYPIYFSLNWETNDNNINPSGIILCKGNWNTDDIYLKKYDKNEIKVDENPIKIIDITSNKLSQWYDEENNTVNNNCWNKEIIRIYKPELNVDSYEDYLNNYEYNKQSSKKLEHINNTYFNNSQLNFNKINYDKSIDNINFYYLNSNYDENGYFYYDNTNTRKSSFSIALSDDIVNNTFKYPVKKEFNTFELPIKLKVEINDNYYSLDVDLSNCQYNYEIAPYMPYGVLEEFKISGTIDFNKIGKKSIDLTTFKYYNQPGYSIFTWGLEAYCEPEHKISRVVFEFYDNHGKCAALHITDKSSFNGVFTNYIMFNLNSVYGLTNKDFNDLDIIHAGLQLNKNSLQVEKKYITLDENGKSILTEYLSPNSNDDTIYFENDAGYLYANYLYLIKINIEYVKIGPLELEELVDVITDYRWFWTTTQFNEYYQLISDFNNVEFKLDFDGILTFNTNEEWTNKWKETSIFNGNEYEEVLLKDSSSGSIKFPNSFSYIIQSITGETYTTDGKITTVPLINLKSNIGLVNDYDIFNISEHTTNCINGTIYLGENSIKNYPEQPSVKFSNKTASIHNAIYPSNENGSDDLYSNIDKVIENLKSQNLDENSDYYPFKNYFNLTFNNNTNVSSVNENISYINENYDLINENLNKSYEYVTKDFNTLRNTGINFNFKAIYFSKYYYTNVQKYREIPVLNAFIYDRSQLDDYALLDLNSFRGRYGYNRDNLENLNYSINDSQEVDPCCKYVLLTSMHDKGGGEPTQTDFAIKNVISGGYTGPYGDNSPASEIFYLTQHDSDMSIRESVIGMTFNGGVHNDPKLYMLNSLNIKMLFPYCIMRSSNNDNEMLFRAMINGNEETTIAIKLSKGGPDMKWPVNLFDESLPLYYNGSLACITYDTTNIHFADSTRTKDVYNVPMRKGNNGLYIGYNIDEFVNYLSNQNNRAPIKYGRMIFSLLTQCFYRDIDDYLDKYYEIDNWVYLENNYTEFNLDIILKIEIDTNKLKSYNDTNYNEINSETNKYLEQYNLATHNKLLLFHKMRYNLYIDNVITNSNIYNTNTDIFKLALNKHISLELQSIQKTFPLKLRFNYIPPDMINKKNVIPKINAIDNVKDRLTSLFKDFEYNLERNVAYCLSYDNRFLKLKGETIINNLLYGHGIYKETNKNRYDRTTPYIKISRAFAERLGIYNQKYLYLMKNFPDYLNYNIQIRYEDGIYLSNFLSGLEMLLPEGIEYKDKDKLNENSELE